MDFFTRQEQSRKTTRFLVVAFALAFLTVVIATTAVLGAVLRLYANGNGPVVTAETWGQWAGHNVALLVTIAAGTLVLIGLASAFRTASLSSGGGQVARMMHATQLTGDGGGDLLRKRLIDVVEEMAIASGLPMPEVYVLEHEPAINAFASGLAPGNAAITVTHGALERLNRAELQGVVAHEFSHILNGDMRINQRLIGLCFGILVLSLIGRWLLRAGAYGSWGGYARYGGRRARNGSVNVALVLGLGVTVIGAIGLLASRLIKAAVSRQRESLADASAVQFTRDTNGLAGALKKIGGFTSKISSVDSEEVAHMLFDHQSLSSLFATHPPLIDRIRALDPSFDPENLPEQPAVPPPPQAEPEEETAAHLAAAAALAGQGASAARTLKVAGAEDADRLLGRTGALGSPAVGGALRSAVPASLHQAAHSTEASLLLVLALALSPVEDVRRHQ
ncbi:MAG TPA: M48 family metallopeptidase, partial [Gammaproteobacteria bacterium]|nr:M48 family metallopeptidase [Gammaproteobacteria bacterium]